MFHASVLLAEHADACFSRIAVQALLGMPLHDPPVNRISLKKLPPAWATDADPHKSLARTYQACAASADFGNKVWERVWANSSGGGCALGGVTA